MDDSLHSEKLDYSLIAYNVRCLRMVHNLTQEDLAGRAGLSTATVRRLEGAHRVHMRGLLRICNALERPLSMVSSKFSFDPPREAHEPYVKRASELVWHTYDDRRRKVPADSQMRIQRENERLRLGRAGVVSMFVAYGFAMPHGPGLTLFEVYGSVPLGPIRTYKDCVYHCVRGELRFRAGSLDVTLQTGDSVGLSPDEETTFEPSKPVGPNQSPPLVMAIAANRVGQLPSLPGGRQRVRNTRVSRELRS